MGYKEKYEQALRRAKKLLEDMDKKDYFASNGDIENIFPELKESKDDRIVRCLLNYFNHVRYNGLDLKGTDIDEVIAWLEKQKQKPKKVSIWKHWKNGIAGNGEGRQVYLIRTGNTYNLSSVLSFECDYIELSELDNLMLEKQEEKATHINREDCGIDGLYHAIRILERTIGRVTGYQSDDGILSHEAAIDAVKELYKKQGEKKPADKIEPKKLDADKVIAWLVANICDFEHYVKLFKKDFGL